MPQPDRSPGVNVGSWLRARAALHPDRDAVVVEDSGERVSYAALEALANRVANALQREGVLPGDRVALALRNEPLYMAVYFAAARLGAILIPLNTRLTPTELNLQLRDAQARLAICAPSVGVGDAPGLRTWSRDELLAALPEHADAPELAPGGEAPQVLMYTSGTTGLPKGALLPHRKTLYNTLNAELYFGLREGDVVVAPVPMFHSYGLKILAIPTLFAGGTLVLVDKFDPVLLQETVARHDASLLGAVPVMLQRMLRSGLDAGRFASLRFAFSAGAALDVETIRAYDALGIRLLQGYGQTETSILCCLDAEHALSKAGSVGRPVRNCELRIGDPEGRAVRSGETGEVLVRGPICMLGYWRQPEATAAARIGEWHRTGDLAVADAEGFVTLVGRLKEMYISGGENVYPAEVERVLEAHPEVGEVAVIGRSDQEWGEVGHAYIVPAHGELDIDGLLTWTRERLAGFKCPRYVVAVEDLPRTASGKVQKHLL